MPKSLLLNLRTSQIIRETLTEPLHMMIDPSHMPVSSKSIWSDEIWELDGYGQTRINWAIALENGSWLTSADHAELLNSFKRLLWSLLSDPRTGKRLSPNSSASSTSGLRTLAKWMANNDYSNFSQLDRASLSNFTQDLINEKILELDALEDDAFVDIEKSDESEEEGDDQDDDIFESERVGEEASAVGAFNAIRQSYTYWKRIYTQRGALAEAGIPVIEFDPLEGKSIIKAARAVAKQVIKKIPPLPDEVALPIMAEAHKWLGVRADDIIKLHEMYLSVFQAKDRPPSNRTNDVINHEDAMYLNTFEFSVEPGDSQPWHPKLRCSLSKNRTYRYTVPTAAIRDLIDTVVQAAAIVLQSETGMRASELISVPSGKDDARQEFNAIGRRLSISGLNELYFVQSSLIKTVDAPEKEEWIAGARPVGSEFIPGPYRAIQVVDRLLAPWRANSNDPESRHKLFVTPRSGGALPIWNASISPWEGFTALRAFKDFVSNKVDLSQLPDQSKLGEDLTIYRNTKGTCVKTHQWRKTWAMYVVRTDRKMIPAISMQFKHLSIAMTESAYIGTDTNLMRERNSQQSRAAATFMYQAITGREKVAGRMAKTIDEWLDELKNIIGENVGVVAIDNLQEWCELRGIKVYSSPHGKCFIRLSPKDAKCHEAGGTVHWNRKSPNYSRREPDACNGCKCFGVDSDHADFWIGRYTDYKKSFEALSANGLQAGFRIIQERVAQSANMLRALNIDPDTLTEKEHA
ncbi:hypothetical protein NX786_01105 [Telluria mixta]|uniref:Integrase n=1 Tax=Telluria mixta TaxID=34071 RepID=A0ABT2BS49_9BURK|nr:hypothetical protein [Telluria mixta]MCS0627941.1 hypothetical protein [Telluria mixta]WEM93940.1 hypothetical protein P0M04_20885 [Telluria mixta]